MSERLSILVLGMLLGWTLNVSAFEFNIKKLTDAIGKAKDLKPVDDKGEAEIGNGVAANLLGAVPPVQDEKLQAYVNQVGLWLALQTERADLPWRFSVLDSDSVNAFAAPGGYVFITRGLLLHMRSEAELAGVLAHEISHVLKRHHLQAIQKNALTGIAADFASMTVGSKESSEVMQKAIGAGTELFARGLDKGDEYEADRMGVVIAARAGYDPYALLAVLQTLDAMNPQDSSLALMFKTHPAPGQRLQLLDGAMTGKMDSYASQPQVAERFHQLVADYSSRPASVSPTSIKPEGREAAGKVVKAGEVAGGGDVFAAKINGIQLTDKPNSKGKVLAKLKKGEEVVATGQEDGEYIKVQTGDGKEVWVKKAMMKKSGP
jgi:predicted Zn-dependent protease